MAQTLPGGADVDTLMVQMAEKCKAEILVGVSHGRACCLDGPCSAEADISA